MNSVLTKVAFVYLEQDNKILLLQEGGKLAKGLWSIPGGHVDEGESFERAAIREAFEESGYKVSLEKIIYQGIITSLEYKGSLRDTAEIEIVIFQGKIISGAMAKDNQALDIKWFTKEEILEKKLRWDFLRDLIISI